MNGENNGLCYTGKECKYKIDEDERGNSLVTGEGGKKGEYRKSFTCAELEVYKLIF